MPRLKSTRPVPQKRGVPVAMITQRGTQYVRHEQAHEAVEDEVIRAANEAFRRDVVTTCLIQPQGSLAEVLRRDEAA